VSLGDGVRMTAAPGWVKRDSSPDLWVELQKGPVVLYAAAARSNETPLQQLRAEEDNLRSEAHDVAFGPEQSGKIGGRTVEMVVFTAIFDTGTFDGEIICLSVEGRIVLIDVVAAQGYLQDAEDDVATMIKSIEVGK
jgi:hypothetical protein